MDSLSRKAQIGGQRQSSRLRRQRSKEWKDYSSSDNEDDAIGVTHKSMAGTQNGSGVQPVSFGHLGLRQSYDDPITHQYEEPRIVIDTSGSSGRKNNFGECFQKPTILYDNLFSFDLLVLCDLCSNSR